MTEDDTLAELLAFVVSGRPESVTAGVVAQMPPPVRAGVGMTADLIASLAWQNDLESPPAALRDRIVTPLRARAEQTRRALLVCDMIVDHLTPGRPLEVPRARAILPAIARRIDEARAAGVPVVYVLDHHAADDPELELWGSHAIEGTPGAEVWPELAPRPGEALVMKRTYSAFHESTLAHVLEDLAVDTLVLTGCATEVQLVATATDALQRGYQIEIPPDAQAGTSEITEAVAMTVIGSLLPFVPARRALLERQDAGCGSGRVRPSGGRPACGGTSAPVALDPERAAASALPVRVLPDRRGVRAALVAAGDPDVPPAVPAVVARDPVELRARRGGDGGPRASVPWCARPWCVHRAYEHRGPRAPAPWCARAWCVHRAYEHRGPRAPAPWCARAWCVHRAYEHRGPRAPVPGCARAWCAHRADAHRGRGASAPRCARPRCRHRARPHRGQDAPVPWGGVPAALDTASGQP